jgi:sulfite reductase beta subunit-like hemoprotein
VRPSEKDFQKGFTVHAGLLEGYQRGEVTPDEFRPIRLSYGLYYQLDHTSHMQRIKLPGGMVDVAQLECLGDLADEFGRGIVHLTTRQDVQYHWVPLERVMEIYRRLHAVGVTTRGACADSVRNVTACPDAGICPRETFDVSPYVLAINAYFLFNPLNLTLPRKFKIAVSGCPEDCAQGMINDIGLYAQRRSDTDGFSVYAGGGLSSQPYLATPVCDFVPAADVLVMCEAIVRVQHRYGERKNRHKARMKYVAAKFGAAKFAAAIEEERVRVARERGPALRAEVAEWVRTYAAPAPALPAGGVPAPGSEAAAHWARTNTRPQRQTGYRMATVTVPLGDLTGEQARGLAALAGALGNGTLRLTNEQNVVVPWIPDGRVAELYEGLVGLGLGEPDALHVTDVVSCPGMDYCSLAMTRSMGIAEGIRTALRAGNGAVESIGDLRVKISGCPNACGQHHVGDIGLTGLLTKGPDGRERPHYSILVGGGVGEATSRLGQRLGGRFPEEVVPAAIGAITRLFAAERTPGESFGAFVERIGVDRLSDVARGAMGPAAGGRG